MISTPVHQRLKRPESTGIIDHYGAVLNTARIGSIGGEHDFMIKVIVPDMTAYRRFLSATSASCV